MSSSFNPDRALLNSKFEGYKLDPLDWDTCVSVFKLPGDGISQSTVSSSQFSQPSFKEVQSRIRHNHISPSAVDNQAGYIDKNGTLVIITYDFNANAPTFHNPFEIPPFLSGSNGSPSREYPKAVAIERDLWLVSDGAGRLFVVRITTGEDGRLQGTLVGHYEVTDQLLALPDGTSSNTLLPLRLHEAHTYTAPNGEISIQVLISTKSITPHEDAEPSGSKPHPKRSRLRFLISALRLEAPPTILEDPDIPRSPTLLWSALGDDIPLTVALSPTASEYLFLASSQYVHPTLPDPRKSVPRPPLPDEIAPIPRAGENLDAPAKPPLYSWTQMGDSITVAFFLPANTPKSHIRITLTAKTLALHVIDPPIDDDSLSAPSSLQIPFFERREWWDGIDASASFWTWEKEGETLVDGSEQTSHSVGVLTLYLEKQHEDTRWPHLFSETQTVHPRPGTEKQDDDVPETLDPTQLLAIRESLEKYTSALASGEDASGLGLGTGLPGLARREEDEEVDEDVGRTVVCTWLDANTGLPVPADGADGWPIEVISLPIPTSSRSEEWSIVGRHDIDGLVFKYSKQGQDMSEEPSKIAWKHTATFPALSFVLATKRDTRFAVHDGASTAFAFESGSSGAGSGNVYLYRGAVGKWGKQSVLKVSGGSAGALLGVVALADDASEQRVVVGLCENELVILKHVL